MKRSLVLALCLTAPVSSARADDQPCRPFSPSANVKVEFKGDLSVRDVAVWLMTISCKNIIIDGSVAPTQTAKFAPGTFKARQIEARVIAAFRAAGLSVTARGDTLIITRAGNRPCPDVAPRSTRPVTSTSVTPVVPEPSDKQLEAEVLAGIKRISSTVVEIQQAAVDKAHSNPMAVMKGARVGPAMKDGKPVGIKLDAIQPGSLYAKLGFENGDTLRSVNGMELSSMNTSLDAYIKLRDEKRFDVVVERAGKSVTLVMKVVK